MLSKTPTPACVRADNLIRRPWREPFIRDFCKKLAGIVEISPGERASFNKGIAEVVLKWVFDNIYHDRDDPHGNLADVHRVLLKIVRCADYLFEQLEKAKDTSCTRWLNLAYSLEPRFGIMKGTTIAEMVAAVDLIRNALETAWYEYGDIGSYPGLGDLVFNLELQARISGVKFSAHRKNGDKGSLLKAIDLLRSELLTNASPYSILGERLPSEGKHPVSEYERILRTARVVAVGKGII
jgi:hypothetical protein